MNDQASPSTNPTIASSQDSVIQIPDPVSSQVAVMANPAIQNLAQPNVVSQPKYMSQGSSSKEAKIVSAELPSYVELAGVDAIEKEPIPAEVERYMEKVGTSEAFTAPTEIVVADKTATEPTGSYASNPVFVLPLGEVEIKEGMHKSVHDSIRWLSTWCGRVVKILKGRVVYREA